MKEFVGLRAKKPKAQKSVSLKENFNSKITKIRKMV